MTPAHVPLDPFGEAAALGAWLTGPRPSLGVAVAGLLLAPLGGALHAWAPGHGKLALGALAATGRVGRRQLWWTAGVTGLSHVVSLVAFAALALALGVGTAHGGPAAVQSLVAAVLLLVVARLLWVRRATASPRADHLHAHHHDDPARDTSATLPARTLLLTGLAHGLTPAPAPLALLVSALSVGRAWWGLAAVLAYGAGMTAALAGGARLLRAAATHHSVRRPVVSGWIAALPAIATAVTGIALAAHGLTQVMTSRGPA
jgi:ABC-type nickel/cobalt efflux system permease component RcnA